MVLYVIFMAAFDAQESPHNGKPKLRTSGIARPPDALLTMPDVASIKDSAARKLRYFLSQKHVPYEIFSVSFDIYIYVYSTVWNG